jgi:hypothetical protein
LVGWKTPFQKEGADPCHLRPPLAPAAGELSSSNTTTSRLPPSPLPFTSRASDLHPARWLNLLCRRSIGIPPSCKSKLHARTGTLADNAIVGGFCSLLPWLWYVPFVHAACNRLTGPQILTGILRHYAMTLLQSTPKKQDLPKIRQQRSLARGLSLRQNANVLSPASFSARKAYMVQAYQEGKFLAEPELRGKPRPNPMSDPAAMEGMMGMMKGNMAMMIPQTLIMGWINAFFSGFVISTLLEIEETATELTHCTVKLPFPLTPQFKSMLQSGVGTRDLDVRWVSSLSWYFLTLFGLQPVYNFILGSNNGKYPNMCAKRIF